MELIAKSFFIQSNPLHEIIASDFPQRVFIVCVNFLFIHKVFNFLDVKSWKLWIIMYFIVDKIDGIIHVFSLLSAIFLKKSFQHSFQHYVENYVENYLPAIFLRQGDI